MLTCDTTDVDACIEEITRLEAVDCEIIRLTVPNQKSVDSVPLIRAEMRKRGIERPLVADVHFNPKLAVNVCEFVDKVRINPGIMQTGKNLKSVSTQTLSTRKNWIELSRN